MAAETKTGKPNILHISTRALVLHIILLSVYEKLKERYSSITQASKITAFSSGKSLISGPRILFSYFVSDDQMKEYLRKLDILDNLPDKPRELLNHYARAKKETELHTLETSYFEEWFLLRTSQKFADMELIDDLSLTIAKYQEELDEDNKKIAQLEAFLADSHVKTADLSEGELVMTEQKLAGATASFVSFFGLFNHTSQ